MSYQRQFNLKYNPDVDRDVIEALERSGSPVDYVRRLVREDQRYKENLESVDHGKRGLINAATTQN